MEFWDTFWATMWGALGGAVVGAAAAWLFSLDLRRREREDRAQDREQERLDRVAEREMDREARRVERQEQRDWEYEERILAEWPSVLEAVHDFANACRAVYDARRTHGPVGSRHDHYRLSLASVTQRLFEAATIAKDVDHSVVSAIGKLTATTPMHSDVQLRTMDQIVSVLGDYMAASPEHRSDAMQKLQDALTELIATAERESAEFLSEEGLPQ
ncbi:hypothetical protein [Microbacterium sp. NPDC078849]|uniref:hypothetical protein n=1 Tax=unclassified Microbacterium TaxID=2609290 RepID=UPI00344C753A